MPEKPKSIPNAVKTPSDDFAPYSLMRSSEILGKNNFSIWKLSQKSQTIHTHDYYQIWYVSSGNCNHKIDNRNFNLSAGDLIIIPPFSYHSMNSECENLEVIGIDFTETFLSEADTNTIFFTCLNPLFVREKEKNSIFTEIAFKELISEMFDEYTSTKKFSELVIRSNLLKLIVLLERKSARKDVFEQSGFTHAISEVLQYIHNNIETKISIKDLCHLSHLSATSLGVHFKKATGRSVISYINKIRTDKAKQLLKETNISITDIAYELGFGDGAYFNRIFKKETGLCPKDYRIKHKHENMPQSALS